MMLVFIRQDIFGCTAPCSITWLEFREYSSNECLGLIEFLYNQLVDEIDKIIGNGSVLSCNI
jgi:hypothetical protein